MLAPTPTLAQSASPPQIADTFESLLITARIEALALLRSLLHASAGDDLPAATIRERRLAAAAILRIPLDTTAPTSPRTRRAPAPEPVAPPTDDNGTAEPTSAQATSPTDTGAALAEPQPRAKCPPPPAPIARKTIPSTTATAAAGSPKPFTPAYASSPAARLRSAAGGTASFKQSDSS